MSSQIESTAPVADMCVKVAVIGHNAGGEPDAVFYDIGCTSDEYSGGEHYEIAKEMAEQNGYQAVMAFDEFDPAWAMLGLPKDDEAEDEASRPRGG